MELASPSASAPTTPPHVLRRILRLDPFKLLVNQPLDARRLFEEMPKASRHFHPWPILRSRRSAQPFLHSLSHKLPERDTWKPTSGSGPRVVKKDDITTIECLDAYGPDSGMQSTKIIDLAPKAIQSVTLKQPALNEQAIVDHVIIKGTEGDQFTCDLSTRIECNFCSDTDSCAAF